jgi:hypothetical protein
MLKFTTLILKVQTETLELAADKNFSREAHNEVLVRNLNLIDLSEVREEGQYLYQHWTGEYRILDIAERDYFESGFAILNWRGDEFSTDLCVIDIAKLKDNKIVAMKL